MPPDPRFKTGLKPTPPAKLLTAVLTGRIGIFRPSLAPPPSFLFFPSGRSMFLNDQYGDCVSAEAAAAAAYVSAFNGKEWLASDQTVKTFCQKYNLLNGADLVDVMEHMEADGFHQGSDTVTEGKYAIVDASNIDTLRSAVALGPVKTAMASSALPSGAGNHDGWYVFGSHRGSSDHSCHLASYGTAKEVFDALKVPVPSGVDPNKPDCFGYYTWSTYGVVDHAWVKAANDEFYVRTPTDNLNGVPWTLTPGPTPPPPPPPPGPSGNRLHVETAIPPGDYTVGAGPNAQVLTLAQQIVALLQGARSR